MYFLLTNRVKNHEKTLLTFHPSNPAPDNRHLIFNLLVVLSASQVDV